MMHMFNFYIMLFGHAGLVGIT